LTKILFIALGSIFLGLGVIGLILPGIPGTPFLLLSSALYVRSSDRLYAWLINHRVFGRHIKAFREHRAMSRRSKIVALCSMWAAISFSVFVVFDALLVKLLMMSGGAIGTFVIARVPLLQEKSH
jgi:uncharacterized protein